MLTRLFLSLVILSFTACYAQKKFNEQPNIIFVLADDVGWSDFGYNYPDSPIPTPFIDELASRSIQMTQYYTHSICTPARASIMTGRYHSNTGMTYVLAIGSPGGLSPTMPSIPSILKKQGNYATAMSGKWHLGHAQRKMTPVGHGFDTFTGNYMWDVDSFSKQIFEVPWSPLMIDWVSEHANGTYRHYAEPKHATVAITEAAEDAIRNHAAKQKMITSYQDVEADTQPLFLYVAYTAAHSPTQPMPHHEAKCKHVPHIWRRQFCGMVVGMDEGIRNLTATVLSELGENTIMVVTSDNGAVPWFGGMNVPLKGSKLTPYEGGVRVPAFIVDFTKDQKYLGNPQRPADDKDKESQRIFRGMMHATDWLPTFLSYAQIPAEDFPTDIDGFDFSETLRTVPYQPKVHLEALKMSDGSSIDGRLYDNFPGTSVVSPRREVLLEMYFTEEYIFGEELQAYRMDDYKYINGIIRDENIYYESKNNWISMSHPNWLTFGTQVLVRALEWVFGTGPFDAVRITMTHVNLQETMTHDQKAGIVPTRRLYNIATDPLETTNLADDPQYAHIITAMEERLYEIKIKRPPQQRVWMLFHLYKFWAKTHVPGDCSMNPNIKAKDCQFTHPWISDDVEDPYAEPGLLELPRYVDERTIDVYRILFCFLAAVFTAIWLIYLGLKRLITLVEGNVQTVGASGIAGRKKKRE